MTRVIIHILPIYTQYLLRTYRDTLLYILFVIAYAIVYNSYYESHVDVVLRPLLTIILWSVIRVNKIDVQHIQVTKLSIWQYLADEDLTYQPVGSYKG